jgi:hypothetical protein
LNALNVRHSHNQFNYLPGLRAGEEKGIKQQRRNPMSEEKEVIGKFKYEQDSKRFHRFKVETDAGIVGTIYIPKDKQSMPQKLILEYAK